MAHVKRNLSKAVAVIVAVAMIMTLLCGTAFAADESGQEDLSAGTYTVDVSLSAYISAMGGIEFGEGLMEESADLTVDADGNYSLTVYFGKSSVNIYTVEANTFIYAGANEASAPGYYADGEVVYAEYTESEDTATSATYGEVNYVDSMTIVLDGTDTSSVDLWIYVDSSVMGVQFCDGSGTGASNTPGVATPYEAVLTIDWDTLTAVSLDETAPEISEDETLEAETEEDSSSEDNSEEETESSAEDTAEPETFEDTEDSSDAGSSDEETEESAPLEDTDPEEDSENSEDSFSEESDDPADSLEVPDVSEDSSEDDMDSNVIDPSLGLDTDSDPDASDESDSEEDSDASEDSSEDDMDSNVIDPSLGLNTDSDPDASDENDSEEDSDASEDSSEDDMDSNVIDPSLGLDTDSDSDASDENDSEESSDASEDSSGETGSEDQDTSEGSEETVTVSALAAGTYYPEASLSCYISAMGGIEFGEGLFDGMEVVSSGNGTYEITIYFTRSSVNIYTVEANTFIDATDSAPGYYDSDGNLHSAEYTLSSDTAEDADGNAIHYVDSMTFTTDTLSSTYTLYLYVNSTVMGVQFCDGSGDGASNQPGVLTPYTALLSVDWSSIGASDLAEDTGITASDLISSSEETDDNSSSSEETDDTSSSSADSEEVLSSIAAGTYYPEATLSCYISAMGGVEFGTGLFDGMKLTVTEDGEYVITLYFTKSSVNIYTVEANTFIDATDSAPGYYDADGNLHYAEYTLSSDTAEDAEGNSIHYVDSMTFTVDSLTSQIYLYLYVNSTVMGVQFCDGSGSGASNQPGVLTPYTAVLTIDWSSVGLDEYVSEGSASGSSSSVAVGDSSYLAAWMGLAAAAAIALCAIAVGRRKFN